MPARAATDLAIELRELRKEYRRRQQHVVAIDGLDLDVRRGEVFGLLGPNGAGKTTTVEICEGLRDATSGSVTVLGTRWGAGNDRALRQRIGVSLQETQFFDKQTVAEILALFASLHDHARSVDEAIGLVSLHEKRGTRSMDLSGGQRQRLAVACALIARPELLFLDEPTTGLDPQSRRSLWDVVRTFRAEGGTVLLTTHYMDEAEQLCDRIAIIDHGKRIALGTPRELNELVGAAHVVEITAAGLATRVGDADIAALPSVHGHKLHGDHASLNVDAPHRAVPALLALCAGRGLELQGLTTRHVSLEDVFVHLTGRHLRDT